MDPGPASGGALYGRLEEEGKRRASVVSLTTRLLETERALEAFNTRSGA